jgi:RNA polymerase sigma-70 factor (ECF subfamily)
VQAVTPELSELWHTHKHRLRGYIAARVDDSAAVDDILQNVFLKAHGKLGSLRQSGSISAWLYRIAANAIADHYRAQRPEADLPDNIAAPPVERDHIAELAACLRPLIDELPAIYRDALLLAEIEGLSQKALAERLGLSHSGAKTRVQRGREKLRQRLHDCCEIELGRGGIVDFTPRDSSCSPACSGDC